MIECYQFKAGDGIQYQDEVELTFEQRQKSRAQATTKKGEQVGWFLERGHVLADGSLLVGKSGEEIRVSAAPETLSVVSSAEPLQLLRAAYHLGNRHVPLQVTLECLCYQHDHVLDDMVKGLGLKVECQQRPFNPENGAYHSSGHHHSHDHAH
ncbi:urease accessory protein UreE [Aurantivibrio plasticivorans]